MKKLTTTMMQETLNKQGRRLTIGLDLGDRSSFYCVLDETGDVLLEQKVSTTPKAIGEIFGAMPRSRIALETGTHSPWVSRLLSEFGHETIVAHARMVATMSIPGKHAAPSNLERNCQVECIFCFAQDDCIRKVPSRGGPAAE